MIFGNTISLLLLLLLIPLVWIWKKSLVDQDRRMMRLSLLCRILAFTALVVALCRPYWPQESKDQHVIYLVDGSQSIDPTALSKVPDWIRESQSTLHGNDTSEIILFAGSVRQVSLEELEEFSELVKTGTTEGEFRAASCIAESMAAIRFFYPSDKGKRLVVLSDGVETGAAVEDTLTTLEQEGVEVFYHDVDALSEAEVVAVSLESASSFAYQGEVTRLTGQIQSNVDQRVKARLLNRGVVVLQESIALQAGQRQSVLFDVELSTPGQNLWTLEVEPEADFFSSNNSVSTVIKVKGMPRYLVLHEQEKLMSPLTRAMKKQGIILDVRGEFGLPQSLGELLAYDGVILADVSATSFSMTQMVNLQRYVTDFGGGLLMLGSENSFGLGGYYKSPVEEVLPLTSRYEKEKQKPSLAMVLVIDKSGSMSGAPIELARASAIATAELLSAHDQIAILGFSGEAHLICDLTSASDQATIQNAISGLDAGGGTNLYPAMLEGRRILQQAAAKVKHMIILSDGQTSGTGYEALAQEMASEMMTVSTVALGQGAAKDLMKVIAQEGGGRYYETEDAEKMPQIFTQETMKASRSAIKEDFFNTIVVGDHPMLNGFEKVELPFILGYVMARPKPTAQVLMAAETGDPLFAVSRFGLGMGAAYTSDLTEKWGGEWLAMSQGAQFWAQALRSIARKEESSGLSAELVMTQHEGIVNIKRRDESGQTVEEVPWDIMVSGRSGGRIPASIKQTGLGTYQLRFPIQKQDAIDIRLHDELAGLTKSLHWRRDYPAEYTLSGDQDAALCALPTPDKMMEGGQPADVYQSRAWLFVILGILFYLTGLVLRRL